MNENDKLLDTTEPDTIVDDNENYDIITTEPDNISSLDELVDKIENSPTDVMTLIGKDRYEVAQNNLKVFLVEYATQQLKRVIKLTNYLDRLEDQLMDSVDSSSNPKNIMNTMYAIQSSLNQALSLVKQVSTDEVYSKLIYNDNRSVSLSIEGSTNNTNAIKTNLNHDERERIRNVANNIIKYFKEEKM